MIYTFNYYQFYENGSIEVVNEIVIATVMGYSYEFVVQSLHDLCHIAYIADDSNLGKLYVQ